MQALERIQSLSDKADGTRRHPLPLLTVPEQGEGE